MFDFPIPDRTTPIPSERLTQTAGAPTIEIRFEAVKGRSVMSGQFRFWACWLVLCPVLTISVATIRADEKTKAPTTPPKKVAKSKTAKNSARFPKVVKSDRYWRTKLNYQQYLVTRRKATEPAFSGAYCNHHEDGVYACIGCGTPLFDSEAKFDSGTGWPSYWQSISRNYLRSKPDFSDGTLRTEVNCRVCDAHLGHVFRDGPRPTGLRFCINSSAIDFVPRESLPEHVEQWRKDMGLEPLESDEKKTEGEAGEPAPADAEKGSSSGDSDKDEARLPNTP